jgi:hypothetical protein
MESCDMIPDKYDYLFGVLNYMYEREVDRKAYDMIRGEVENRLCGSGAPGTHMGPTTGPPHGNSGPGMCPPNMTCQICEPFTRGQDGGMYCGPDKCHHMEIVNIDGYCEKCPKFTRASADQRMCETPMCSPL